MFGPEYGTIGSPTYLSNNTFPIGDGGHHLNDSILTQNGTNQIHVGTSSSPIQFPNVIAYTDTDTGGGAYAVYRLSDQGSGNDGGFEITTFAGPGFNERKFRLFGGGNGTNSNIILASDDAGDVVHYKDTSWNTGTTTSWPSGASIVISGSLDVDTGASVTFNGAVTASGLNLTGPATSDSSITTSDVFRSTNANGFQIGQSGNGVQFGNVQVYGDSSISAGNMYTSFQLLDSAASSSTFEITTYSGLDGSNPVTRLTGGGNGGQNGTTILGAFYDSTVRFYKTSTWVSGTDLIVSGTLNGQGDINLNGPTNLNGQTTINDVVTVNSEISSSTHISASAFVGDGSGLSGVAKLTSNTFSGTQTLSGSIQTEVAIQSISSNTASIDFSDTSLYELTLASSADTHIDATNIGKGQTINLLITQPSPNTGSLSFSSKFLQPTGSEYTASAVAGAQDILTLMTFNDTTKIYVAAVNQLS